MISRTRHNCLLDLPQGTGFSNCNLLRQTQRLVHCNLRGSLQNLMLSSDCFETTDRIRCKPSAKITNTEIHTADRGLSLSLANVFYCLLNWGLWLRWIQNGKTVSFFCSVFENVEQRMRMRKMSFDKCCRLKEERRRGRPCSELLNGAPPAPRQNNRPANPIKPKTKKYIWRLAGNKSPSRNNNAKNENLRNKMVLYV